MKIQQLSPRMDAPDYGHFSIELASIPLQFLRISLLSILAVTFLHFISTDYFVTHALGWPSERASDIRSLFQVDQEQSIPTWMSTMLLMACGIVLLAISRSEADQHSPLRYTWLSLGLLFVLMSLDEHVGFHEVLSLRLGQVVHSTGFFAFAWVIPGLIFVVLAGFYYLRAFRLLPEPYLLLFFSAGAIYVTGSLLTEMLEAKIVSNPDASELAITLSLLVQDPLELVGTALFLFALLRYSVRILAWRQLTLGAPPTGA